MTKVSVCIITYNHKPWIRQAVESVLAQNRDFELEVLVFDDHSTDGTSEVLHELVGKHPKELKVVIQEVNQGAGRNFWQVMHQAKGQYLAFLEGDDYWVNPDRLKKQLALFDQYPDAELVVANTQVINQSGDESPEVLGCVVNHKFARPGVKDVLRQHYHISSYLMRSSVVPRFESWYNQFGNVLDIYHLCEAVRLAPAVYLDEIVSVRRMTGVGVYSKLDRIKKLRFDLEWSERLYAHFKGPENFFFYERVFVRAALIASAECGRANAVRLLFRMFRLSPYGFVRALARNFRMTARAIYDIMKG